MKSPPPVLVGVTNSRAADLFSFLPDRLTPPGVKAMRQTASIDFAPLNYRAGYPAVSRSKRIVAQELPNDPREFPVVSDVPELPLRIPDEIVNYYAFVFCQGGFRHFGLTFEQFLLVVDVVKSPGLCAGSRESVRQKSPRY